MKKYFIGVLLVLSTLGYSAEIGAKAALNSKKLTQNEMLTYALQDEYLAKSEYQRAIDAFGNIRPFSNLKKSEEQQIRLLLPLFKKYNVPKVNENEIKDLAVIPSSRKEAINICFQSETNNIAMYDKFLADENLAGDIKVIFSALRNASETDLRSIKKY